ncbi:hypothetical protein GJU43_06930 [Flavobacterium sp. LC2016-23]|uniref:hypothetical protein n=1 Tax=Flavobacterium sp. LC2016-23 TaxID=2666330 RepID=UPI0012AF9D2F|nr:hypothetical protein [Flavobacterium sp. LC2016-23]MRX39003.1 hypothetical protein [Flavobacterium sp. LC2016-23]
MQKITFEDYKNAVRAKFEIEREGVYFNFLTPPSQANLRNLCWERFKSNSNKDDLSTFSSFFEFEFDPEKKNHFREQTDRFRPIGSFLRGEKDPANRFAVELAAVLVDFQPRPFRKYKERGIVTVENPIDSPKIPFAFAIKEENNEEKDEREEGERKNKFENALIATSRFNYIENLRARFSDNFKKKVKFITIGVLVVFGLGFIISRYAFPKKQCMQWSNDHYEKVDCDLSANGLIPFTIEPFDEIKFELKKIKVCDTTTCFKNGKPIIWYAKTGDAADFFNTHGIHPENEKALRPVTQYIFNKYKKPCGSK